MYVGDNNRTNTKSSETSDLPTGKPIFDEVKGAMKNNKVPKIDKIPSKLIKIVRKVLHRHTHTKLQIWDEDQIPSEWNESIIIPIHKGTNKSTPTTEVYP